jgi:predicted esterase
VRRTFFLTFAAALLAGCAPAQSDPNTRLKARPQKSVPLPLDAGTHSLGPSADLYIPKSLVPDQPAPLMVFLHGAGRHMGTRQLEQAADEQGFILLRPVSEGSTWDAIRGYYGPDVRSIDKSLARAFTARVIDPNRIALAGFSDGASYALGLGLSNGDLFKSVIAFSPGFIPDGANRVGSPKFFFSHGTADQILPIDSCSRRLVPELKRAGFNVTYKEFDGPHGVPNEMLNSAIAWFLGK